MYKLRATWSKIPWFYLLIGLYPLFFLWASNKTEIDPAFVLRPMMYTLLGILSLFTILYLVFKDLFKAALFGSLILILFFSYGHVYYWLREITGNALVSRHRILGLVYVVILMLGAWGVIKGAIRLKKYLRPMNLISLILVMISALQLGYYYVTTSLALNRSVDSQFYLNISPGQELPDVYYIVLDTYMRSDALEQDMGFDNEPFVQELEQMGFYVAGCSRPNYDYTHASLVSSLNMDYLPVLQERFQSTTGESFWTILKNNELRQQLEQAGYTTVAFLTTFNWSEWENADIYLGPDLNIIGASQLHPFEALYLKSTAMLVLNDLFKSIRPADQAASLSGIDFPYQYHVDAELFALDQLPNVPKIPGHKFVFVHILIPHVPYVFSPTGEILSDPGFFSGKLADAINEEYRTTGYLDGVQFINNRITPILRTIINESAISPIIILQGDHGFRADNRRTILNAYYFPDGYQSLYPSITPVNTFRIVLDEYFGANYPILPDQSYTEDGILSEETYPDCLP